MSNILRLSFKPSGHICLPKSLLWYQRGVSPLPLSACSILSTSFCSGFAPTERKAGGQAEDVIPRWEGQEWRARLPASSRCSPSFLPPCPAPGAGLAARLKPAKGRGSRADAAAFPPLPLAHQQAPSLPRSETGLGRACGTRGKKEVSWERGLENWEGKGGLETGQFG